MTDQTIDDTRNRVRAFHSGGACLSALATMALAGVAGADVLEVPAEFPTITIAIANAANGDEIVVSPGTYFETLDFGSKNLVLRGTDPGDPDVVANTVIDAFGLGSCLQIFGGQGLQTVVEGITFRNGDAGRGGGIRIQGSFATVRNCRFVDNVLTAGGSDGGAIFVETGGIVLEDSTLIGNSALDAGGAVYLRTGTNNVIRRCTFEGNVALNGGGLALNGNNTLVEECDFIDNGALEGIEDGGAVWAFNADATFDRCAFVGNLTTDDGGAMHALQSSVIEVRNSVFDGNVAASNAGALYAQTNAIIFAYHCTFIRNEGAGTSTLRTFDNGAITVRNSVLWDNVGPSLVSGGALSIRYTAIEGGFEGTGNIGLDPLLDADGRPFPGSPVIDAGDSRVLLETDPRDFDGNRRALDDPDTPESGVAIYGLVVDMGAFEFVPEGQGPTCEGDLNGDGTVNGADLSIVLGAWGTCP